MDSDIETKLAEMNRSEVSLVAKKLGIRRSSNGRRLKKSELLTEIRQHDPGKVRGALNLTWWERHRWHVHVYGGGSIVVSVVFGIIGCLQERPPSTTSQPNDSASIGDINVEQTVNLTAEGHEGRQPRDTLDLTSLPLNKISFEEFAEKHVDSRNDPRQLTELEHTHHGTSVQWNGIVVEARDNADSVERYYLLKPETHARPGTFASCYLNSKFQFRQFKTGERLSIDGVIDQVNYQGVTLTECVVREFSP